MDFPTDRTLEGVEEYDEVVDVLDLPQLYTKPSAKILLAVLADLNQEPPSWDKSSNCAGRLRGTLGVPRPAKHKRKIRSEGVPSYLTKIVSSPLSWILSDDEKEQVWEAASHRLSERSGRTGMGAISRTFTIPLSPRTSRQTVDDENVVSRPRQPAGSSTQDEVEITLHEPALTADNLGLKTWAASYLLAKRLTLLRPDLPALAGQDLILELGAGTGLVGLAAAAIFQAAVYLTDLPAIVPNLARNALANEPSILSHSGGKVHAAMLDWSNPSAFHPPEDGSSNAWPAHSFPLILAADPLYSPEHPKLLVQAIGQHLKQGEAAKVVVEMPVREAYAAERTDFRVRMSDQGLRILDEGEEIGYDDWSIGPDEEELAEVRCWWSVWGWK